MLMLPISLDIQAKGIEMSDFVAMERLTIIYPYPTIESELLGFIKPFSNQVRKFKAILFDLGKFFCLILVNSPADLSQFTLYP